LNTSSAVVKSAMQLQHHPPSHLVSDLMMSHLEADMPSTLSCSICRASPTAWKAMSATSRAVWCCFEQYSEEFGPLVALWVSLGRYSLSYRNKPTRGSSCVWKIVLQQSHNFPKVVWHKTNSNFTRAFVLWHIWSVLWSYHILQTIAVCSPFIHFLNWLQLLYILQLCHYYKISH